MGIITISGFKMLQDKLKEMQTEATNITSRIKEARGDSPELSENKELIDALEDQKNLDIKITELKEKLEKIKVVDIKSYPDEIKNKVNFGATVTYINCDTDKETTVKIVGTDEISLSNEIKEISYLSPVGSSLLKKEVGEEVDIITPSGDVLIEIISIKYK